MSVPDPQLAALKADERQLMASIAPAPAAVGTPAAGLAIGAPGGFDTTDEVSYLSPKKEKETSLGTAREDPKVALERAKLKGRSAVTKKRCRAGTARTSSSTSRAPPSSTATPSSRRPRSRRSRRSR